MNHDITKAIDEKVAAIKKGENTFSTGRVRRLSEYIVEVVGLEDVCYFERVRIGDKAEGYVDAIEKDVVLVALVKKYAPVYIGDEVVATGREFCAKYSQDAIGHVVDMFGEDTLSGKMLDGLEDIAVESQPISIMDRTTVNRPLLTGIAGIDLMYPIGKGQRQLIIGDKKTGKTQIALDTIVNQKGKNVLCIYVAIGKTKKEVKEIYSELLRHDAMQYSLVFAAFNDACAPVLRNTPYAAISVANGYMRAGADVLVVIDDLKRHADVCREIALLLGKVPGRDAYPPDIFYSHSRMLEMGCQHKDGGSITILPLCETKSGDITDYISTNIISITDGQIVLSAKNFERGQKPAINYGLSVSRLGGAVQTKEMKKSGTKLRQELLAYLEQREVFELANADEMGEALRERMVRGAKILQMLKQHKYAVQTSEEMLQKVMQLGEKQL